ncbi:MAG TPA: hypothetical protein VFI17_09030 [Solirubrobacterales bacterium]|nr:hypothetical protein [Solirubrobacterales bacterium]
METALEPGTNAPDGDAVSQNIARFVEEHEMHAANRRNMHIHEDEDDED